MFFDSSACEASGAVGTSANGDGRFAVFQAPLIGVFFQAGHPCGACLQTDLHAAQLIFGFRLHRAALQGDDRRAGEGVGMASACFWRSGVTYIPEITASYFLPMPRIRLVNLVSISCGLAWDVGRSARQTPGRDRRCCYCCHKTQTAGR